MAKLTNVSCVYTGGGIYVYSARFNDEVWIGGGLDNYFGSYDLPLFVIDEYCYSDYDSHWKKASVLYPTWNDIIQSLREEYHDDPLLHEMEASIIRYNPNLNERCIGDVESTTTIDKHSERLETLACIIELFEDFLDERGIDVPNDEKEQDPDSASTIYGTDYGELEGRLESLLIRLGLLEEEC